MTSRTIETSLRLGLLRCLFGGDFGAVILVIVDSTVVILVDCLVAHGWAGPICLILEGFLKIKMNCYIPQKSNRLMCVGVMCCCVPCAMEKMNLLVYF